MSSQTDTRDRCKNGIFSCVDQKGATKRTLGDLLYKDKEKVCKTEDDWVALIQTIATRDQLALHYLYEQTHRLVFTLIARITNNSETAEELTVDVFHDVWRKAAAYDPANGSVIGWIMIQARSRAIDRLRFEHRKKRSNIFGQQFQTNAANNPELTCATEQQNRLVRNALDTLTREERKAIETAFFSELTYQDAAAKLKQPVGTFKARIRSGLGKLRQALGRTLKKPA